MTKNPQTDYTLQIETRANRVKAGKEAPQAAPTGRNPTAPTVETPNTRKREIGANLADSGDIPKQGRKQGRGNRAILKTPAEYAEEFLSRNPDPMFLFFGRQWLNYDRETGWRLEMDELRAKETVQNFLLRNYPGAFKVQLLNDVFSYVKGKWTVAKDFDYTSWLITNDDDGFVNAAEAPYWLPCKNCLLNVKTRETKPFTPRLVSIGRIPCDFIPGAESPIFESFLSSLIESNYRETLLMACGISLIYERRKSNVFFLLSGPPGTGKSTFVNILKRINAGAVCKVPLADFGERFGTSDLTTYRVNIVEDMEDMREGGQATEREAVLKSVTCGEAIKVEDKYQKAVARPARALCFFTVNETPKFVDQSEAISDRMRVFPFRNRFRGTGKQKTGIEEEITAELPGVLNLFLAYLHRYFEIVDSQAAGPKTFPESAEGAEEKAQVIRQGRPWETWFEENTEQAPEVNGIPSHTLYELYRDDTQASGYRPVAENRFLKLIFEYYERHGVKLQKTRVRITGGQKTYIYGLNSQRLNREF